MRFHLPAVMLATGLSPLCAFAQSGPVTVGILPVYDASSAPYGETMAPTLTMSLYRTIAKVTPRIMLLNPGGLYNPGEVDAVLEYARAAGATAVVVGTLKSPERRGKESHLAAEAFVIDLNSARRSSAITARTKVSESDIQKKPGSGLAPWLAEAVAVSTGNRSSQPISRAAEELARSLHDGLKNEVLALAGPDLDKSADDARKQTCDLTFGVFMTRQNARAANYTVALNGREESSGIVEGVLKTSAPAGVLMVSVLVKDPPTRIPVQARYLADTLHDCSRPVRQLVLEIGAEGEGRLAWR